MSLNKAKVFTITSVKGGVGKTTTVLNLAGIFKKMNKKVLIIDLDVFNGDISAMLNIDYENDLYNLYEDLNNKKFDAVEDYITNYCENISVISAPKDPRYAKKINGKFLETILYKTSMKYDVILLDTNHILTDINLFALEYSNSILYVINNDSMNLKNMKTMVSILNDMNRVNYKIILNEARDKNKDYYNKFDIKNIMNKNVNYIIPSSFYIKNIDKYIIEGKILTLDNQVIKNNKNTIKIFELIASNILEESKVD